MKILSIGNSFSQDGQKWLHKLAQQNGTDLICHNLYIGGCSLSMHYENIVNNKSDYDFEVNGNSGVEKISIIDALRREKYDVITIQQVSGLSGIPETYFPYISIISNIVRWEQPQAELYLHQTWAYEIDSNHGDFTHYNKDQGEMYRRLRDAYSTAAKIINAKIIPTGDTIQKLRETLPEFDYKNGGLSLNRDGFHLSFDYGRFAAACVWFKTLTGKKIKISEFEDFDISLLNKIIDVIEN